MSSTTGFCGRTNKGRGFRITFANGWGVSVQWGAYDYCASSEDEVTEESATAEIAVFTPDDEMLSYTARDDYDPSWETHNVGIADGNDVLGWLTPSEVLRAMSCVANFHRRQTAQEAITEFRKDFYKDYSSQY